MPRHDTKNKMDGDAILFYEPRDPYYEFSNFYKPKVLVIDGQDWPTTEHYFQGQKFAGQGHDAQAYIELIRQADTPNKAFILSQQKKKGGYAGKWLVNKKTAPMTLNEAIAKYAGKVKMRGEWEAVRLAVMKKALMAKFSQNEALKNVLLGTGSHPIVENSPRDSFWGVGKDGTGANHLGRLLEEVREALREGPKSVHIQKVSSKKKVVVKKPPGDAKAAKVAFIAKMCPEGKILNPPTKRCVNMDGKIGRALLSKK